MSHNIAGMPPFARMPLGGMGMGVGMGPNAPHPEPNAHPHPPPPPPVGANPKKKRRTNTNVAPPAPQPPPTVQDLLPPPLSGYGDTIIASNPFDDTPPQSSQNSMMHGGPQPHMHPHHPHHMGGPPMRGMSPLTSMGGMSPMMSHNMSNMSPMGNSPMGNHINHMGGMSPMNHAPMGGMSPMNNMGQNIPPSAMNNHMNISHMGNTQMSGPPIGNSPMNNMNSGPMGSPMNNMGHSMGSPMGGGIGSPMNNIPGNNHNHMSNGPININNINSHMTPNSPLNGPSLSNVNSPLSHNGSQHQNHMGNNIGRPINGPMTTMNSMVPNNMNMSGPNSMNNINMGGPPINNMGNMNIPPHPSQMGHMRGGPGGGGSSMGGGPPPMGHPMNIGGNMPPHGYQGPSGMAPKPMPVSAGKIYPVDTWMVFNSQNPNAPPIYPCGNCHKEVHDNDQGIFCESGCNFWYHRACSGLSESAFQLLTHEPYAEWACDKCSNSKNIPLVKFKP